MPNELAKSNSPYLLKHANNPVDWLPWGDEAFERAVERDCPVFVSIGYTTCHWCNVMEEESFSDAEVAALLNEAFVCVKVDREERPEVDNLYMTACQLMTGSAGWPLNVVLTHDRKPFFAATYIPKDERFGRPGLMGIVPMIMEHWRERRSEVKDSAERITGAISAAGTGPAPEGQTSLDPGSFVRQAMEELAFSFDDVHGGFGSAPKFPTPHMLMLLARSREKASVDMAAQTLRAMRLGGIFDQVGLGFHRYSTDARWHVPHFEKMLHDQALITLAALDVYQATGDAFYAKIARETLTFVLEGMRGEQGAFHAAWGADSDGREGVYYFWRRDEVRALFSPSEAEAVADALHINEAGNFEDPEHGGRTGLSVPFLSVPRDDAARAAGMKPCDFARAIGVMFEHRMTRPAPELDDKVLADWNGLMIAALARASAVLGIGAYHDAARTAARFVLDNMRSSGRLLHSWRRGTASLAGNADDYAFMAWGLIELYGAGFEPWALEAAMDMVDVMDAAFFDPAEGGYFFAQRGASGLPVRRKELYDSAIPSANSVMLHNLLRLASLTGQAEYEKQASELFVAMAPRAIRAPSAHSWFAAGALLAVEPSAEVVVVGRRDADDTRALIHAVRTHPRAGLSVLFKPADDPAAAATLAGIAPFVREYGMQGDRATAYLCEGGACRAPITDAAALKAALGADPCTY